MEKNAFLSRVKLDILHETLQEMDQELVSIVNRYREGMRPLPTQSKYTLKLWGFFFSFMLSPSAFQRQDRAREFHHLLETGRITRFVHVKMCLFLQLTCNKAKLLFSQQNFPNTPHPALVPRGSCTQPRGRFPSLTYLFS